MHNRYLVNGNRSPALSRNIRWPEQQEARLGPLGRPPALACQSCWVVSVVSDLQHRVGNLMHEKGVLSRWAGWILWHWLAWHGMAWHGSPASWHWSAVCGLCKRSRSFEDTTYHARAVADIHTNLTKLLRGSGSGSTRWVRCERMHVTVAIFLTFI